MCKRSLLLLLGLLNLVSAAATPSLEEVVQAMQNADKRFSTHSMSVEHHLQQKNKYFTKVTTRRDEATGRYERKTNHYVPSKEDAEKLELDMANHSLWDSQMGYIFGASRDSTVNPLLVSKQPEQIVGDGRYAGGELLRGTLGNPKPVWDVMVEQNGQVQEEREEVDGVPCLVLKSDGEYGNITVWVDDAHGYVIRKLDEIKGPDSISYSGMKLREFPDGESQWEFHLDNVQVDKIDGHYVPVSGVYKRRNVSKGGAWLSTEQIRITSLNFNPDFAAEGAFKLDVPEGTEVWDLDVQGLKYTWNKGELVPMVDPEELEAIMQTTEQMVIAQGSPEPAQGHEIQLPQAADMTTTQSESKFSVRAAGSVLLAAIGCVLLFLALRNHKRAQAAKSETRPK